jgi:integrase
MKKRRCVVAGLPSTIFNHWFRATCITIHQENGGRIEDAAELAGHSSTRTKQLYKRKSRARRSRACSSNQSTAGHPAPHATYVRRA